MDLGYFWSLARGVRPRLEWGHARALSFRAVAAVWRFPSRGSRDLWLSLEAFRQGFPTRLPHRAVPRAPWCESILGLKVEAVQGKQVSLEWPEKSGGLWEWGLILEFLSSFLCRAPPLEMRQDARNSFPTTQGEDPSSRASRRKRSHSGSRRDSPVTLEWRPVCRGTS